MKKIVSIIALVLVLVVSSFMGGCKKDPLVIKESDTYIVITASNEQMDIKSDTTLVDYMTSLKNSGLLDFEMANGMVTAVNGIENPADWSSCWMLYTSDTENSNDGWGRIEYKGVVYGSAVVGAESLVVKEGCLYIWVYQAF